MDVLYPERFVFWTFCYASFGNGMFCNWTFCNCGCTAYSLDMLVFVMRDQFATLIVQLFLNKILSSSLRIWRVR
jgi:hypothetical protein